MKALAQAVSLVKSNHYFKSGIVWLIFGAFVFIGMHQQQKTPVVTQAPVEVSAKTDETTKLMARQLQEIQTQLANLKQEVEKPKKPVNLAPLEQQIYKLGNALEAAKSTNNGTTSQLLNENKALAEKLDTVKLTLSQLNQTQNPVEYLEPSALPFKVLAIDNIQEQAVLAIEYNFHPVALERGDEIAGWKVLNLDYGQQLVEFINKDNAHIQLSMKQVG